MNKATKQAVMEVNKLVNTPYQTDITSEQDILKLVQKGCLVFHEDSGHGWLQVPHELIDQLGIKKDISGYSYRDDLNAYLEEDCDLGIFLLSLGIGYTEDEPQERKELRKSFFEIVPNEYRDHSPIRNKKPY